MKSGGVELAGWQRKWLDALPPERRHVMSEVFHRDKYALMGQANLMDRVADLGSRVSLLLGENDDCARVAHALGAEALRAIVRDDLEWARELFEAHARMKRRWARTESSRSPCLEGALRVVQRPESALRGISYVLKAPLAVGDPQRRATNPETPGLP